MPVYTGILCKVQPCLLEVPFQQALEGFAVAGFVAGHFMDRVMDGVQAELLGLLGQVGLALGGAILGFHADAQVFLGAGGDDLAQELRELGGVLGFFECGGLPVFRNLRIAFTGGGAAHGEVHADFGAFTLEVGAQAGLDLFRDVLGHADHMLGCPGHFAFLLDELGTGNLTNGALFGRFGPFMNVSADGAYPLHNDYLHIHNSKNVFSGRLPGQIIPLKTL